jgi:UDP-2,3-diacylglucosamine pyrophosphatase LpxH
VGHKLKFVLSDLHLGVGHQESNYLEDFTVDTLLAHFLQQIWRESEREQREIELIINGDLFEFLQVPAVDQYDPNANYPLETYLDSSEAASIKRLDLIVQAHPEVFAALSDFMQVEAPQRRITIIKGNHDVNLYWSGVKARLREVLDASGERSSLLLFAEEFVSRE